MLGREGYEDQQGIQNVNIETSISRPKLLPAQVAP